MKSEVVLEVILFYGKNTIDFHLKAYHLRHNLF